MTHHIELPQRLVVEPALSPEEVAFLAGFTAAPDVITRLWPGRPATPSPWAACAEGCCLCLAAPVSSAAAPVSLAEAARWLRYLIREILAPRAAEPVRRARRHGLPGGHRVDGRVLLEPTDGVGLRLLVVVGGRVSDIALDDDLFPLTPGASVGRGRTPGRGRTGQLAPVVDLAERRRSEGSEGSGARRAERSEGRRAQSTER